MHDEVAELLHIDLSRPPPDTRDEPLAELEPTTSDVGRRAPSYEHPSRDPSSLDRRSKLT